MAKIRNTGISSGTIIFHLKVLSSHKLLFVRPHFGCMQINNQWNGVFSGGTPSNIDNKSETVIHANSGVISFKVMTHHSPWRSLGCHLGF